MNEDVNKYQIIHDVDRLYDLLSLSQYLHLPSEIRTMVNKLSTYAHNYTVVNGGYSVNCPTVLADEEDGFHTLDYIYGAPK